MQRRYSLAHLTLASIVVLVLTLLMAVIDAQAQIAFQSDRDRNYEIYVMDDDGKNQQNLTNYPRNDVGPTWFVPAFAVAPAGKKFTMWGWLKRIDR